MSLKHAHFGYSFAYALTLSAVNEVPQLHDYALRHTGLCSKTRVMEHLNYTWEVDETGEQYKGSTERGIYLFWVLK